MPIKSGLQTLQELRSAARNYQHVPVILWSSSAREQDIDAGYRAGANAYLVKPMGVPEHVSMVRSIASFWCAQVQLPTPAYQHLG